MATDNGRRGNELVAEALSRTRPRPLTLAHYQVLCARLGRAYYRRLRARHYYSYSDPIITRFSEVMAPRLWASGLLRGGSFVGAERWLLDELHYGLSLSHIRVFGR